MVDSDEDALCLFSCRRCHTYLLSETSLVFRPFPFGLKVLGFQRDMAKLSNKCGKKSVLVFIIDPRNKTRAVDTLISKTETLFAAKGEGLFRYTLRVE